MASRLECFNLMYFISLYAKVMNFFFFFMTLQLGKTKVFLRAGHMAELDARRAEVLSSAAKIIQRRRRTHIARRHFIAVKGAAIYLQSFCRGESPTTIELHLIHSEVDEIC